MTDCCVENLGCRAGIAPPRDDRPAAGLPAGFRSVLAAFAAPARRLHRYRNLRSALLYDALSRRDEI